jgi:hypothetical protein
MQLDLMMASSVRQIVVDRSLGRLSSFHNVSVNEELHKQYQVASIHDETTQNNILVDIRIWLIRHCPRLSAYCDTDNHLQDLNHGDDLLKIVNKQEGKVLVSALGDFFCRV